MNINRRLEKLEQLAARREDPDRIKVIEVWGDRGNGPVLLDTFKVNPIAGDKKPFK